MRSGGGQSPLIVANIAALHNVTEDIVLQIQSSIDGHKSSSNTSAHTIDNIVGLQSALDSKQDDISGYTGSLTVVTGVNFAGQSITSKTINITNGIISSIV